MKLHEVACLIESFVGKSLSAQDFCIAFEGAWNFSIDRTEISPKVCETLNQLFDEVVLFSSLPREKWGYPKYRDANEILLAAESALVELRRGGTAECTS
ncbi:hypothetical protein [Thermomonas sp.]|uniref:hypothetical protein n=1 Tax=Thermomonas sp. TaxID=1971895 RepID=UPI002633B4D0|nr:hypothetical protein [Thermomonas sp.]